MAPVSSAVSSEKPRLSRTPRAFICTQEYPVGNEGTRIQRHDSVENTGSSYGRWLKQKGDEEREREREAMRRSMFIVPLEWAVFFGEKLGEWPSSRKNLPIFRGPSLFQFTSVSPDPSFFSFSFLFPFFFFSFFFSFSLANRAISGRKKRESYNVARSLDE